LTELHLCAQLHWFRTTFTPFVHDDEPCDPRNATGPREQPDLSALLNDPFRRYPRSIIIPSSSKHLGFLCLNDSVMSIEV
jgi:hypothetical protein